MKSRLTEAYLQWVRRLLPSPFTIALVLTLMALVVVLVRQFSLGQAPVDVVTWWSDGLWNNGLMVFAMQMMLMLVLGHVLALSPAAARLIEIIIRPCDSGPKAAAIVALFTMIVGFFNWGLGLVFGAILARKVGEKAYRENIQINYPLVGAAGYAALLIWHGGFSGSSLIKVAENGHLASLMGPDFEGTLPEAISLAETAFSGMNIVVTVLLLLAIPGMLYLIGRSAPVNVANLQPHSFPKEDTNDLIGAERLDRSGWFSRIVGGAIVSYCIYLMISHDTGALSFFNPNNINLLLFGLCLLAHANIRAFLTALDEAIHGASGILIQFPLYFGILALMSESGLINDISRLFIQISNETTYPIITFISAGIVNIFVPSGGGQWAIQGPIIIQSSQELGIPLAKSILAMAYGDEVTNMLQPFWALPLLGITRLSAKDILPYTLLMFLTASAVFVVCLLIF